MRFMTIRSRDCDEEYFFYGSQKKLDEYAIKLFLAYFCEDIAEIEDAVEQYREEPYLLFCSLVSSKKYGEAAKTAIGIMEASGYEVIFEEEDGVVKTLRDVVNFEITSNILSEQELVDIAQKILFDYTIADTLIRYPYLRPLIDKMNGEQNA